VSTTTKKATNDWSLTPRGVASTVAQATGGVAALAAVGELAHVNPVWGAGVAVAGALGHLAVSAHRAFAPSAIVYRLGCWAGVGGWATYVLAGEHNLWSQPGLISLGAGALVAGIAAPLANNTRDGRPSRALILRSAARVGDEWEARFRRVCRVNVTVTNITHWATGAGYDVYGKLPQGGATLKQLRAHVDQLAADADLPEGCGIEIVADGSRAKFIAHVSTVNRLLETTEHPADYSPRSIYDDITLGEHRNSTPAVINLRENSGVVTGQKRSGKTNTLDVITAGVGRCRDAIVWHIDLNGGGISQAWLHAWLDGDTERPAVDWAASTPEEALYMTTLALAIAKHRKSAYRKFKVTSDDKLLRLSAQLPEIVIVIDEGAESMGIGANGDPVLKQVRDNLEQIQRIGGNEGVNPVLSALRATQDMVSPAVIKQSRIRIGMLVQDTEELAYLYGWQHRDAIDPADLAGQGSGFISSGTETPRPFKAYLMRPSQVVQAAVAIAGQRPDLDAASAAVADGEFEIYMGGRKPSKVSGLYAGRYERMRAAFTGEAIPEPASTEVAVPEPSEMERYRARRQQFAGGDASAWPELRTIDSSADEGLGDAGAWPTLGGTQTAAPIATQAVPVLLTRALAAFDDAGDDRMHSETLAQALKFGSTNEMAELLRPLEVRPLASWFMRNNTKARGYARESFVEAAQRVARGDLEVPDEVAEWPAA
jgi:hypothetical protein